jgi:hypothetical protein
MAEKHIFKDLKRCLSPIVSVPIPWISGMIVVRHRTYDEITPILVLYR